MRGWGLRAVAVGAISAAAAIALAAACGGDRALDLSGVEASRGGAVDAGVTDASPARVGPRDASTGGASDGDASAGADGDATADGDARADAAVRAERIATGVTDVDHVEASETTLYLASWHRLLQAVAIDGGALTSIASGVTDFTVVPDGVVYAAGTDGGVAIQLWRDGGVEPIADVRAWYVAVASWGRDLAYDDTPDGPGPDRPVELTFVPYGGAPIARTAPPSVVMQLLLDDANAYTVYDARMTVVPRDGGAIRTYDAGASVRTPQVRGVAQDDGWLYFRADLPDGGVTLLRQPKDGGPSVAISPVDPLVAPLHSIAVDDKYVYYACTGFALRRVPKSGGAFEEVDPSPASSDEASAMSVAVNARFVFWTNQAGDAWRRAK